MSRVGRISSRTLLILILVPILAFLAGAGDIPARAQANILSPAPAARVALVWESTGGPGLPLAGPFEMALDPHGNLWVADGRNSRFQIFAPDGAFLEAWGLPGSGEGQFDFVRASGDGLGAVAFDAAGNVYVVDTGNVRVQKFDAARQFITAWGTAGAGDGQFLDPVGIAVGPDGSVYVIDDGRDDVQVFTAEGAFRARFGGPGADPGQIADAGTGIAIDRDGNVLIADSGKQRIERFAPDGTFLEAWARYGMAQECFIGPTDVAVDEAGRIYVTDAGNRRIQVFTPDGHVLAMWGRSGSDPGEFVQPVAIVLDGLGNAYVSDTGANRIQKFRLDLPDDAPGADQIETILPSVDGPPPGAPE